MTETKEEDVHSRFIDIGLKTVIARLKDSYQFATNKDNIKVRVSPNVNDGDPTSYVVRITLCMGFGNTSDERFYAKFYYHTSWEERVQRELEATMLLWEQTRSSAPAVSVVQPVLCLPEHRCLVTRAQSGSTFRQVMRNGRDNMSVIENAIKLYVRWLGILQNIKTEQYKKYNTVAMDFDLRSSFESCQVEGFISRRVASRLLSASERLIVPLRNSVYKEVASQNTVHLRNILITEEGICLLDFGRFCYQSAYIDISNFWYALSPINPFSMSERDGNHLRKLFLQAVRHQFSVEDDILAYFLLYALVGDAARSAKGGQQGKTWRSSAIRLTIKTGFRYRFSQMLGAIEMGF